MKRKMAFVFVLAVLALLAVSSAITVVTAQDETPPEVPIEWIHGLWAVAKAVPIAFVTTFAVVIAGYLSKTAPRDFKLENFIYTLLISLTIGILTLFAGWTYADVQQWLATGFITWYIWKVAKILAGIIAKKLNWAPTPTGPPAA